MSIQLKKFLTLAFAIFSHMHSLHYMKFRNHNCKKVSMHKKCVEILTLHVNTLLELRNVERCICKAELWQSFSKCVYCMLFSFLSNYAGLANQGNYFKTQPYTVNAHWKLLSPLSFSHSQSQGWWSRRLRTVWFFPK